MKYVKKPTIQKAYQLDPSQGNYKKYFKNFCKNYGLDCEFKTFKNKIEYAELKYTNETPHNSVKTDLVLL